MENNIMLRHLMSPLDFSVEELDSLMDLAGDIEQHREKYAHACDGKILATLFMNPVHEHDSVLNQLCFILADKHWALLLQAPLLLQRVKVYLIQFR